MEHTLCRTSFPRFWGVAPRWHYTQLPGEGVAPTLSPCSTSKTAKGVADEAASQQVLRYMGVKQLQCRVLGYTLPLSPGVQDILAKLQGHDRDKVLFPSGLAEGTKRLREGANSSTLNRFAWKTCAPPGDLRTQEVSLHAPLLACSLSWRGANGTCANGTDGVQRFPAHNLGFLPCFWLQVSCSKLQETAASGVGCWATCPSFEFGLSCFKTTCCHENITQLIWRIASQMTAI